MLSVIDICNKALSLINVSNINDLSEASAQARVCRFHYEICRDSVLREHPWGFARTFSTLAVKKLSQSQPARSREGQSIKIVNVF